MKALNVLIALICSGNLALASSEKTATKATNSKIKASELNEAEKSAKRNQRSGPGEGGGGNSVGNELLDFYENKGTKEFNPKTLPAYKKYVDPMLSKFEAMAPGVREYLEEGLLQKRWLLEPKKINETSCLNKSVFTTSNKIAACQNHREIRLYTPWINSASELHVAGLIMHELLVYHSFHAIVNGSVPRERQEDNIRELNRNMFSGRITNHKDLMFALGTTNMKTWFITRETHDKRVALQKIIDGYRQKILENAERCKITGSFKEIAKAENYKEILENLTAGFERNLDLERQLRDETYQQALDLSMMNEVRAATSNVCYHNVLELMDTRTNLGYK